jgi:hypothetical protein
MLALCPVGTCGSKFEHASARLAIHNKNQCSNKVISDQYLLHLVYIVETYPNMAVFDTITDKMTVISAKVFGSLKQADQADANREEVRKILGTEMIREMVAVK